MARFFDTLRRRPSDVYRSTRPTTPLADLRTVSIKRCPTPIATSTSVMAADKATSAAVPASIVARRKSSSANASCEDSRSWYSGGVCSPREALSKESSVSARDRPSWREDTVLIRLPPFARKSSPISSSIAGDVISCLTVMGRPSRTNAHSRTISDHLVKASSKLESSRCDVALSSQSSVRQTSARFTQYMSREHSYPQSNVLRKRLSVTGFLTSGGPGKASTAGDPDEPGSRIGRVRSTS